MKKKLIKESLEIEKAGIFISFRMYGWKNIEKITNITSVPTIGIGSSKFCDGQILVTDDLIGLSGFKPKFVKNI